MARIDVSNIPGYAEMSAEDKVAALEAYALPDPDYTGYVKKSVFDSTASELSKLKKERVEKLSEEERKAEESKNLLDALQKEVEQLRKEKVIGEYKASYLALGYNDELATSTAEALASGDTAKVFANAKAFLDSHDKSVKADVLKGTPKPPAGENAPSGVDYAGKANSAQALGDMVGAAAYLRLQQEQNRN